MQESPSQRLLPLDSHLCLGNSKQLSVSAVRGMSEGVMKDEAG